MSVCSSRSCCTCSLGVVEESLLAQHRPRFRYTLKSRCRQPGQNQVFPTVFSGAVGVEDALVAALALAELERILSCRIPGSQRNRTRTQCSLVRGHIARGPGMSKGRCLLAALGHHSSLAIPGLTQQVPG